MKNHRNSLLSDVAFLMLVLLCNIFIIFTASNPNSYFQNLILLNFVFLFAIVTYFTNVTAGLVLNVAFIFGYGIYIMYQTVLQGETIGMSTYFWLIMTPLPTVVTWIFTLSSRQLQTENEQLRNQASRLATLDEHTDLKNSLSFRKDVTVFSGISTRYKIPLTLLVIKVKHWDELRRFIHADQLAEAMYDISQISQASIRTNDALYLLDSDNPSWGLLLFTDKPGTKVVIERIKQKLAEFNMREFTDKYKVELSLVMGAVEYTPETIESPMDFIVQAKKQLEYDV